MSIAIIPGVINIHLFCVNTSSKTCLRTVVFFREQAAQGLVAYGVDLKHVWKGSNKAKTIDLALGIPKEPIAETHGRIGKVKDLKEVLISCEAKSCMTEHGKSQPRIYDELSSSHEIVTKETTMRLRRELLLSIYPLGLLLRCGRALRTTFISRITFNQE